MKIANKVINSKILKQSNQDSNNLRNKVRLNQKMKTFKIKMFKMRILNWFNKLNIKIKIMSQMMIK